MLKIIGSRIIHLIQNTKNFPATISHSELDGFSPFHLITVNITLKTKNTQGEAKSCYTDIVNIHLAVEGDQLIVASRVNMSYGLEPFNTQHNRTARANNCSTFFRNVPLHDPNMITLVIQDIISTIRLSQVLQGFNQQAADINDQ